MTPTPETLRAKAADLRRNYGGYEQRVAILLDAAADAWEELERQYKSAEEHIGTLAGRLAVLRMELATSEQALQRAERWKRAAIEVMNSEGIYTEECIEATAVMLEDEDAALAQTKEKP